MAYDPKVGNQWTDFEEPDLILMKLVGAVTPPEAREVTRRHVEWGRERDHAFFLIDARELGRLDPEVRRVATASLKEIPVRGMAVYGAPLKAKVMIKLVLTALNLISSDADKNPTMFFDDEARARAWIEKRRGELRNAA